MIHVAAVVYFWGESQQDRLLCECLGPLAAELRSEGSASRLWFDRYDARGPHVFVVLSVPEDAAAETFRRLEERIRTYLVDRPSSQELSREELEARHAGCRGRCQCEADRRPGLAENNSFCLFAHDPRGYPFRLSEGVAGEGELWDLIDHRSFQSIRELAPQSQGTATAAGARWIAAVDRALRLAGRGAGEYWRYHAGTLLLPLEQRLAEGESEVLAALPGWIGERNRTVFSRLWEEVERSDPWPGSRRLVTIATSENGRAPGRRWALLREIDHFILRQLGLPVRIHIPLILYAWYCHARAGQVAAGAA